MLSSGLVIKPKFFPFHKIILSMYMNLLVMATVAMVTNKHITYTSITISRGHFKAIIPRLGQTLCFQYLILKSRKNWMNIQITCLVLFG